MFWVGENNKRVIITDRDGLWTQALLLLKDLMSHLEGQSIDTPRAEQVVVVETYITETYHSSDFVILCALSTTQPPTPPPSSSTPSTSQDRHIWINIRLEQIIMISLGVSQ